MNSITVKNDLFYISTGHTSYCFRVDRYLHLEHLYYGKKIRIEQAYDYAFPYVRAWGNAVDYNDNDELSSLDPLPQEYGTYGKGDYKEASIEIEDEGSYTLDFLYDSYEIFEDDVPVLGLVSSHGAEETLVVHLKDSVKNIALDLVYRVYPKEDVISRSVIVTNHSGKTYILRKLMSYCLDLYDKETELLSFHGAWAEEMQPSLAPVNRGKQVVESRIGCSGAKTNPGFLLKGKDTTEDKGEVWGFNLVYSGDHYSSIEHNEYKITRIQGGIQPERFAYPLETGIPFYSPEAILSYSDQGMNDLSHHFHHFIERHITTSNWKDKERPILINSWEAFGFEVNEKNLASLGKEAEDLGIELFVLDDGWFGRRKDDHGGLGDYDVNEEKFPNGLKKLADDLHERNLLFGIWIEPEAISVDSKLYEEHPEYAITEKDREPVFGRHELLMDLTKKEVRDYIVDNVTKLLDENDVDYVKWDMNRKLCGVSQNFVYDYMKGLYEVLDRIFSPRPYILFESCAAGGNRFDLGMMCFSPQVWASDNTDPTVRHTIQKSISYLYPLSVIGAHVSASPNAQTGRKTPLETRFHVAAYGCLGFELDLSKLSDKEKEEMKKQISFYKKHRKTFRYGDFRRIEEGFLVEGEEEAIFSLFKQEEELKIPDLREGNYEIISREYYSLEAGKPIEKETLCADASKLKNGLSVRRKNFETEYASDMYVIRKR